MYMVYLHSIFCSIGGLFTYAFVQALLWCLFHSAFIFYGVIYPVYYRVMSDSGKMKYVHLSVVVVAVTLPMILILMYSIKGGFGFNLLLHYSCFPNNTTAVFYSFIIPLDLFIITNLVMLLIVFAKIRFEVSLSYFSVYSYRSLFHELCR